MVALGRVAGQEIRARTTVRAVLASSTLEYTDLRDAAAARLVRQNLIRIEGVRGSNPLSSTHSPRSEKVLSLLDRLGRSLDRRLTVAVCLPWRYGAARVTLSWHQRSALASQI